MRTILDYLSSHLWPVLVWTAIILLACSWPGKDLPESPIVGFDKIVHIGMFVGWTVLWLLPFPRKVGLIVPLGVAFGVFLEFYQQWLPFDRTFDWWDAAADGLGVLIGWVGWIVVLRIFFRPKSASTTD